MEIELSAEEQRVLGALMEKAVTTPEYYPLTLNSLTLACNQKTSRDPVTDYDEDDVRGVLDDLRDRGLVFRVDVAGSRVPKFRASVRDKWELNEAEYALTTVLLLRGAQTLGQLRTRTERLHAFRDLSEVQETLEAMQNRAEEPTSMVRPLPLHPGSKEVRFVHTLGEVSLPANEPPTAVRATVRMDGAAEIEELRGRVDSLEAELAALRAEFEAFKAQF
jgi:hypothetical protein